MSGALCLVSKEEYFDLFEPYKGTQPYGKQYSSQTWDSNHYHFYVQRKEGKEYFIFIDHGEEYKRN